MSDFQISEQPRRIVQIESQYLPCLEYFTCLLQHDIVWVDAEERYVKQTFRNRCLVLTANKLDTLTVPVKSYEKNCSTRDIEIDYSQDWIRRHIGCLKSAYGKSPFFEFYFHEFEKVYHAKPVLLADLNYELLTICLRLLGIKQSVTYNLSGIETGTALLTNAMSLINNRKRSFDHKYYRAVPYYQTFGNDFVSNLGIIDLIFNTGPEARSILNRSVKNEQVN